MEEHEIPQMIISDPVAIFYLTGKWIFPGERLLALYLNVNGNHKMMINKLFPQESDLGVDIIYYDDIEDGVEILSKYVEKDKTMGIDKTWPSKFLIRLQELGGGSKFVNGSPIIDYIRMVKDEKEQDLMRKSSKINDIAMDKIIPWVAKGLTEKELNAKMREIYKELGCEDVSFDPITAYGHGAADPHHVTDDSKGKRGDCVILDIGGFKDNYASDMTRTVFIGEGISLDVDNFVIRVVFMDGVGDGVQKVGLAQAGLAVDKQWVITLSRIVGHRPGGGVSKFV